MTPPSAWFSQIIVTGMAGSAAEVSISSGSDRLADSSAGSSTATSPTCASTAGLLPICWRCATPCSIQAPAAVAIR